MTSNKRTIWEAEIREGINSLKIGESMKEQRTPPATRDLGANPARLVLLQRTEHSKQNILMMDRSCDRSRSPIIRRDGRRDRRRQFRSTVPIWGIPRKEHPGSETPLRTVETEPVWWCHSAALVGHHRPPGEPKEIARENIVDGRGQFHKEWVRPPIRRRGGSPGTPPHVRSLPRGMKSTLIDVI